eukprot:SAG11_NODE_24215_length_376_cov_1.498195_1_plen_49_part_01
MCLATLVWQLALPSKLRTLVVVLSGVKFRTEGFTMRWFVFCNETRRPQI